MHNADTTLAATPEGLADLALPDQDVSDQGLSGQEMHSSVDQVSQGQANSPETESQTEPQIIEIVVRARQGEVSPGLRRQAEEKLAKIGKFDQKIHRVDVELSREANPRLADIAARVELTVRSRGPVVRAEAAATDPPAALDLAWEKLQLQLRRTHDRKHHHAHHGGNGTHSAKTNVIKPKSPKTNSHGSKIQAPAITTSDRSVIHADEAGWGHQEGDGPFVLREKTHTAAPMTVDDALYEMELVGHDFFLFVDQDSQLPCVLYRRRGYSYGLLRLATPDLPDTSTHSG